MNTSTSITRQLVAEDQRVDTAARILGNYFSFNFEPFVYDMASQLSQDYRGGYWEFYTLSNGGFYMSPQGDKMFKVSCQNGFDGNLSADAFGLAVCLFANSNLSFSATPELAEVYAEQFHLLREYMFDHEEVQAILRAID